MKSFVNLAVNAYPPILNRFFIRFFFKLIDDQYDQYH